jgi:hypothetical protein
LPGKFQLPLVAPVHEILAAKDGNGAVLSSRHGRRDV